MGDLFSCPTLQHAGLCFNRLAALELPAALPAAAGALVSLDLSHNALCALAPLLRQLRSGLPRLRVLSLLVRGPGIAVASPDDHGKTSYSSVQLWNGGCLATGGLP